MADAKKPDGDTILARIMRGVEVRDVTWPRLQVDGQPLRVRLRSLTCSEVQECYAAAFKRFADLEIPTDKIQTADQFEQEIATQVLFRACRNPADERQTLAKSADELREHTTPAQRATMLELYAALAVDTDPDLHLPDDVRAAIGEAVKKKDGAALKRFASYELATFMLTSADPPSS